MKASSAVLAPAVLLGLLAACGRGPPSSLADLAGTWANEDSATGGITHLKVHLDSGVVLMDVWGACHPSDCYWGAAVADTQDWRMHRELHVTWDHGFARGTHLLTQLSAGRLSLTTSTHFVDSSGRADYDKTDYFRR